ncbi:ankyrin repeat domain-containing protein 27 [Dendroctonus ponderosae]|uniref:VPS9 domain-containing protein n=1 Tax=Dendroctonus ponderosae TaxID=77166 RepID=A0AAR5QAI3_DENPD|nr:ankyrin repeat domain-containing protein 27 [Dendroctonus ponderosae]
MWSQYDEDLSQNQFFKEIKQNHQDIIKRATEDHWIICVPRAGTLTSADISVNVVLDHILIPGADQSYTYTTLSKKEVLLVNHHLTLDQNTIFHRDIEILFEETHYLKQKSKYLVWCVNVPLFTHHNQNRCPNNNVVLVTIQDCIDFLYSETFGHNLLEGIHSLCVDFWKTHQSAFYTESLQSQKDYLGNLYSQSLQLCFKNDIIRDKCDKNLLHLDNFKLSIETYMQYCLGRKLMYSINTLQHLSDCCVNKIVRNSSDISLKDLGIPSHFLNYVFDAKSELSRLNNVVTGLDKLYCLSRVFNIFSNKLVKTDERLYLTSDDFLQILVYLVLNSNISNWMANLTYLKEFQFALSTNHDQQNFLVSSLEAALAFIKSNQFLDISKSVGRSNNNQLTVFDKIYHRFKDKRDVKDIESFLEKEIAAVELCHPLCSCIKCEQTDKKPTEKNIYKMFNKSNQNFLIVACRENNPEFLEYILSLGFDINFQDDCGRSALHYAAEKGFQEVLLLLISAEINVNLLDNDRNTALHLACDRGHDSCVKALLYSSRLVEINLQNLSGETPMFLATRWGYLDIIKILLESGASVCLKNNSNVSVYKLSPNYYITQHFTEFGSFQSKKIQKELLHIKPEDSLADLDNVSDSNANQLILTEQGLFFGNEAKTSLEMKKLELLMKVIESNDVPLTCYYLGYSGNAKDANSNEQVKCHPLCSCTKCLKNAGDEFPDGPSNENSNLEIRKFNINMRNKDGYTLLHVAAKFGRTEIVRILLDDGALLNVRTLDTLFTPLHLAVKFQKLQTVKELLQCGGCNVEAQDHRGNTPLYYACKTNNIKIVELLLQNGADCHKKNYEEQTVLQLCEDKNLFRIRKMFRENIGGVLSSDCYDSSHSSLL